MHIISGADINEKVLDRSVVTIGNFDGVHCGHSAIFAHLVQQGISRSMPTVVVTFDPHPLKILAPASAPQLITTLKQKSDLIEKCGVDYLLVVHFTREFSQMSAGDFVNQILYKSLGMRHIIIGHDYAFGRGREGDFEMLQQSGAINGFTVEDLPPIGNNGSVFSSSLARTAIADGDMAFAKEILGRYYQISGTVVHGRDIGHSLGFPTANISTVNELLPSDGVYAVIVQVDGDLVKGACNIGFNPTFGGIERSVEVFLLDYAADIYNHEISLQFVHRLRAEKKFSDTAALKSAIVENVAATRQILEGLSVKFSISESKCAIN
ncbi:MAG: bifunctional riboflavin kinase/FAD synthetase [Desulfuromonadaceae bacterium]|nr:bifunctional riboflavin kinase/FAD synthetase [Desulfuromonadaceae bacterium]MDD2856500.1 bifunctional riboflavin kinase/FAD synthetase [Desulfuromonadaceae bacterium]